MLDQGIVEWLPRRDQYGRKLSVNLNLQDDFSLNQTLSLYLVDTVTRLDQQDPEYALRVLTLVESVLENLM
ncbi:MAG: DUF3516 domain-containing protein [Verrucomicrobia bacterium]|nr:DUF3516 domain-containing protein [Verrucomicrobiota bacterium]